MALIYKINFSFLFLMGTILDLNKGATYDYVDNAYWSLFQIRVKYLLHKIYVDNNLN